jgi:hypothetical protein
MWDEPVLSSGLLKYLNVSRNCVADRFLISGPRPQSLLATSC